MTKKSFSKIRIKSTKIVKKGGRYYSKRAIWIVKYFYSMIDYIFIPKKPTFNFCRTQRGKIPIGK